MFLHPQNLVIVQELEIKKGEVVMVEKMVCFCGIWRRVKGVEVLNTNIEEKRFKKEEKLEEPADMPELTEGSDISS